MRRLESAVGLGNFDFLLAVEGLDDFDVDLSRSFPEHVVSEHAKATGAAVTVESHS